MNGPSRHLTWAELACWNRLGRPFSKVAAGERIAPYPQAWRETRAIHLADSFECARELTGGLPITVHSGYRTRDYNRAVGGVDSSQHLEGRAIDIAHSALSAREFFACLWDLVQAGKLPLVGGLGSYPTFVHLDIRPKVGGHVARWYYPVPPRS